MGRILALILIIYIGFTLTRFFIKLFGGPVKKAVEMRKKGKIVPPWRDEDVEDADFEEIK